MQKITIHVCENFASEIEEIFKKFTELDFTIKKFPSYCGRPILSEDNLDFKSEENDDLVHLVLGGICLSKITQQKNSKRIFINESNCFYLLLNKELVDHYISDGAYLITPSWLTNWRRQIETWGFDQKTAGEFFAESCKYILLLDTGINPESENLLAEFGRFVKKEVKTIPIGLDYLRLKLLHILNENIISSDYLKLKANFNQKSRKVSDYAMAFDLAAQLVQNMNEKMVIDKILTTINILFAPDELHYLCFQQNQPKKLYLKNGLEISDNKIWNELSGIKKKYQWLESGNGFIITIKSTNDVLGILRINNLAFPQYKEHYLNLGLFLSNVCGLAIENARSFQLIQEQQKQLLKNLNKIKDSEKKLKISSERLKILNKIIRHDLSNDFIVIKSAINIFKQTKNKKMLEEIEKRTTKSLNAIADYRRYETFIESNTDLIEIQISEVVNELIYEFSDVNIDIEGDCKVYADDGLYSVFKNLFSNSILHGKATRISIKISDSTYTCIIKFMDNGTGVPDKIKKKIFDEGFFYGKSGHTGIGLHIVKKTIESYGGSISVEDNEPSGVVFVIRLRKVIS